jgi:hypothetical protein
MHQSMNFQYSRSSSTSTGYRVLANTHKSQKQQNNSNQTIQLSSKSAPSYHPTTQLKQNYQFTVISRRIRWGTDCSRNSPIEILDWTTLENCIIENIKNVSIQKKIKTPMHHRSCHHWSLCDHSECMRLKVKFSYIVLYYKTLRFIFFIFSRSGI